MTSPKGSGKHRDRYRFSIFCFGIVDRFYCCRVALPGAEGPRWKFRAVAPYTAHLSVTRNRLLPDGSSWNSVSVDVIARDRQGRIYEKTEHGVPRGEQGIERYSFFVQDPSKRQTLTWDSNSQVAVLGHWPYWSGRKGCWADAHGQHPSSFGDWYAVPGPSGEGKLETTVSITDTPGGKRIKTRVVTENIGQKKIRGMNAYGIRTNTTPLENGGPLASSETTTELWKSSEFDLKLLQLTSGSKYGLERIELTDLQQGDPDPALFEPPHGYTIETIEYHQVTCGQN